MNRDVTVFGQVGYENLRFDGTPPTHINDAIWGIGATWTPNPDGQITVGFGHRYGQNNVAFDGSFALTARTRVSASYTTGLQNDLQGIQGQLDCLPQFHRADGEQRYRCPLFIGTGGLGVRRACSN